MDAEEVGTRDECGGSEEYVDNDDGEEDDGDGGAVGATDVVDCNCGRVTLAVKFKMVLFRCIGVCAGNGLCRFDVVSTGNGTVVAS